MNVRYLFVATTAFFLLSGCGDKSPESAPPNALAPPAKPMPKHFYAYQDAGEYGYEQAISAQDRNEGRVTKSLLMFRYLGKKAGAYQVMLKEDEVRTVAECSLPCEYAKVYTFVGVNFIKKETLPISPATLLAGVFADAINGNLDQMRGERDGVATTFWVDGEKKKLLVQPAETSGVTK